MEAGEIMSVKEKMTAIANAIRAKTGGTEPLSLDGMAQAITDIEIGVDTDVFKGIITRSITEISSDVTSIGDYAFYSCKSLKTADFPLVTSINGYCFKDCTKLTTVNFPVIKIINQNAFNGCSALTKVKFPVATTVGANAFSNCTSLKTADFPALTYIYASAFSGCSNLTSLILRSEKACTLSENAFASTPIESGTGYIYAPAKMVNSYKGAMGWSAFSAQLRALENYTVDGTITGELDPTKI